MVCCYIENPNSKAYKHHLSRIKDYLWVAEDGMKMQVPIDIICFLNFLDSWLCFLYKDYFEGSGIDNYYQIGCTNRYSLVLNCGMLHFPFKLSLLPTSSTNVARPLRRRTNLSRTLKSQTRDSKASLVASSRIRGVIPVGYA